MGKGLFRDNFLYPLVLALALVSCGDGVDSSSNDGVENTGSASSASLAPSSHSTRAVTKNDQTCAYMAGFPYGTLDCDEKTYKTVTITLASSSLTLMAENLNIGTRVNGKVAGADQSNDALIEKYCRSDTEENCTTDGGLYQWSEAMGFISPCNSVYIADTSCAATIAIGPHQGICPMGWHIPRPAEWNTLASMLGGDSVAGKTMKLNITGHSMWDYSSHNDGNSSGFSALPVGWRNFGGLFYNSGIHAFFWEASEFNASFAGSRGLVKDDSDFTMYYYGKTNGFSVRCFRD